jgi:hypothetical protein
MASLTFAINASTVQYPVEAASAERLATAKRTGAKTVTFSTQACKRQGHHIPTASVIKVTE